MLYRGECRTVHEKNEGRIFPKNMYGKKEVVARYDGSIAYDGRFTYGRSEENRAAAHQIESGLYDGCSVSTTRSYEEAKRFALFGDDQGVVYWIDENQFDAYGIVAIEPDDPAIKTEEEVTIRAADGGEIPPSLIVRVDAVERL